MGQLLYRILPRAVYCALTGQKLPEVGPNTGYNNLTLLLGVLIAIVVVIREFRLRATQREMGSEMAPTWVSVVKVTVLVAVVVYAAFLFAGGRVGTSFPVSGLILLALVVLYSFITNNMIFGRHIYAVGGNRLAAQLSGVKSKRVHFLATPTRRTSATRRAIPSQSSIRRRWKRQRP